MGDNPEQWDQFAEAGGLGAEGSAEDLVAAPDPGPSAAGGPGSGSRRWLTVALGAVAGVLLVLSLTLGVGYAAASADRADQRRALAAERAERERLAADLARLQAKQAGQDAELARLKSALDPAGYARIKKCVTEQAKLEKMVQQLGRGGGPAGDPTEGTTGGLVRVPGTSLPTPGSGKLVPADPPDLPTPCLDALPYVK